MSPKMMKKNTQDEADAVTVITRTDTAKIRKDSEKAIKNDGNISYQRVDSGVHLHSEDRSSDASYEQQAIVDAMLERSERMGRDMSSDIGEYWWKHKQAQKDNSEEGGKQPYG